MLSNYTPLGTAPTGMVLRRLYTTQTASHAEIPSGQPSQSAIEPVATSAHLGVSVLVAVGLDKVGGHCIIRHTAGAQHLQRCAARVARTINDGGSGGDAWEEGGCSGVLGDLAGGKLLLGWAGVLPQMPRASLASYAQQQHV